MYTNSKSKLELTNYNFEHDTLKSNCCTLTENFSIISINSYFHADYLKLETFKEFSQRISQLEEELIQKSSEIESLILQLEVKNLFISKSNFIKEMQSKKQDLFEKLKNNFNFNNEKKENKNYKISTNLAKAKNNEIFKKTNKLDFKELKLKKANRLEIESNINNNTSSKTSIFTQLKLQKATMFTPSNIKVDKSKKRETKVKDKLAVLNSTKNQTSSTTNLLSKINFFEKKNISEEDSFIEIEDDEKTTDINDCETIQKVDNDNQVNQNESVNNKKLSKDSEEIILHMVSNEPIIVQGQKRRSINRTKTIKKKTRRSLVNKFIKAKIVNEINLLELNADNNNTENTKEIFNNSCKQNDINEENNQNVIFYNESVKSYETNDYISPNLVSLGNNNTFNNSNITINYSNKEDLMSGNINFNEFCQLILSDLRSKESFIYEKFEIIISLEEKINYINKEKSDLLIEILKL